MRCGAWLALALGLFLWRHVEISCRGVLKLQLLKSKGRNFGDFIRALAGLQPSNIHLHVSGSTVKTGSKASMKIC